MRSLNGIYILRGHTHKRHTLLQGSRKAPFLGGRPPLVGRGVPKVLYTTGGPPGGPSTLAAEAAESREMLLKDEAGAASLK